MPDGPAVGLPRRDRAADRGPGDSVNEELRAEISTLARRSTPEQNLRRIDAIFAAREKMLEFTVPPPLALESMMLSLRI